MKKPLIFILALITTFTMVAGVRAATTIDFDELWVTTGLIVNNQYAPEGITFQTSSHDQLVNTIVSGLGFPQQSGQNVLAAAGANTDGYISFGFSPPAVDVSFTALSVEDGSTVQIYSESGALQATLSGTQATEFYSYSAPTGEQIGEVVIFSSDGFFADPFAIDDVTFTLIPEPASLALLAFGSIVLLRRKRR